jgi:hypothetical protein
MPNPKLPRPAVVRECPVCRFPQTRIRRKLDGDQLGATSYVCSRVECSLGIDLAKVRTWVAD